MHAGQFVDRIGVALGLQFPTGPALEQLAEQAEKLLELPVSVRKLDVSLSGPATAAMRKLEAGANAAYLALGVEHTLAETFARLLRNGAAAYGVRDVILVGGVGPTSTSASMLKKSWRSAVCACGCLKAASAVIMPVAVPLLPGDT